MSAADPTPLLLLADAVDQLHAPYAIERFSPLTGASLLAVDLCAGDRALDADPLLIRLEWRHDHTAVHRIDAGELFLRESPFDPVADLPVRRLDIISPHNENITDEFELAFRLYHAEEFGQRLRAGLQAIVLL